MLCNCGCKEAIKDGRRFAIGHNSRTGKRKLYLCLCGCGQSLKRRRKWASGHRLQAKILTALHTRLLQQGNCLVWTGEKNNRGYGRLSARVNGKSHKFLVHRLAWELEKGAIPDKMILIHSCDNAACARVSHLKIGTRRQNAAEAVERLGRWAKLTPIQVQEIRAEPKTYGYRVRLATRFGVTRAAIGGVIDGHNWRWLP